MSKENLNGLEESNKMTENIEFLAEDDLRKLIREGYSLEYIFDKIHTKQKMENKDIDDFEFSKSISIPKAPPNKEDKEALIIHYLKLRSIFFQLKEHRKRIDALFDQGIN